MSPSGATAEAADPPPAGFAVEGTLVEPYVEEGEDLGAPIVAAQVRVYYYEKSARWWGEYSFEGSQAIDFTDEDGKFSLFIGADDLVAGRTWSLHVLPSNERQADPSPLGSMLLPLDAMIPPSEATLLNLGVVVLPEPNVRGTLRDRPGSATDGDDADPVPSVWTRIEFVNDSGGTDWSPRQILTTMSGTSLGVFAFHVAPELLDRAVLHVDGGHSTDPDRLRFLTPLGDLSDDERLELAVQYPEPNVTGRLTRAATADDVAAGVDEGDRIGVSGVSVQVQRRQLSGSDVFWDWSDSFATTAGDGRFWLVHAFEPGEVYRLSIDSGPPGPVLLPAFTVPLEDDGSGAALDMEPAYPEPNVSGTIFDTDGDPVPDASVDLRERVQNGLSTWSRWLGQSMSTDADGRFAFFLESDRLDAYADGAVLEVHVAPPSSSSGELPGFILVIPSARDDLLGLNIAFPVPDITGTLTEGGDPSDPDAPGDPVEHASVHVQRRVTEYGSSYWEWLDAHGSTDALGRFALSIPAYMADLAEDELRLRIGYSRSDGVWSRFSVPLDAGSAVGMSVVVPEPNVSGTVLADLGAGPVPVNGAEIELRQRVEPQGFWRWTDSNATTASDGTFAMIVDQDVMAAGDALQLRVRPPDALGGAMTAFTFSLVDVAPLTGLDLTAPAANLSGVLRAPDGSAVAGAWFSLERETTSSGPPYWAWVDSYGRSGPDGRFALTVPDVDEDARYRLRFEPPWSTRSTLVAFTTVIGGTGVATDLELAFPSPNVSGVLRAPDGAAVPDAWISLEAWNEEEGYWESRGTATTVAAGTFVLFAEGDAPHRLSVHPPWDRGDLVRFVQTLDLSGGPATGLDLTFPLPNLRTVLVDGATPVRGAHVWVERLDAPSGSEWLDVWQSSDLQGRIALRLPDAGSYRLHVSPPWEGSLPGFERTFEVSADGTVGGIGATLAFPTPSLVIEVEDVDGEAVPRAYVEVRPAPGSDDRRYSVAWASTNRQGRTPLTLAPGTYRVFVHPPWWSTDLAFASFDIEVVDGGATSTEQVVLRAPNVRGTLDLVAGPSGDGGWIEVENLTPGSEQQLPGTQVRLDGTFRLGLPTGQHLLRVWSDDARASAGPLEAVVTIDGSGSVSAWRYAVEASGVDNCPSGVDPCTLALSYDDVAVQPNLTGTVVRDGTAVEGAFVTATSTDASGSTGPSSRTAVSDGDGVFRMLLPDGAEVTLTVVLADGDLPVSVVVPGSFTATTGGTGLTIDVAALLADAGAGS